MCTWMSVKINFKNGIGGSVVRNTAGSEEAGSGRRVSRFCTYPGFVQRKSSRLFSAGSLQSITKNYSQIPVTFFRRVAAAKWWGFLSVFVCSLENI